MKSKRFSVVVALVAIGLTPGIAGARLENSLRIMAMDESGRVDAVGLEDIPAPYSDPLSNELHRLFVEGYPPVSLVYYGRQWGATEGRVVDIGVGAGLPRELVEEPAQRARPWLPGGVCHLDDVAEPTPKPRFYSLQSMADELGRDPTLADVANAFFSDLRVLSTVPTAINGGPYPDWATGQGLMSVPVSTLRELLNAQGGETWYQPGDLPGNPSSDPDRAVLVSLYRDDGTILVDGAAQLDFAGQSGQASVPVVFLYESNGQLPLDRMTGGETGGAAFENVINAFMDDGKKMTTLPNFEGGDWHLSVPLAVLDEYLSLPDVADIPADRVASLTQELNSGGFDTKPLKLSLVGEEIFADNPERVAVALSLGIESANSVFFTHGFPPVFPKTQECIEFLTIEPGAGIVTQGSFGGPPEEPTSPPPRTPTPIPPITPRPPASPN